jgi:Fe-Mn family superoxide dismutase
MKSNLSFINNTLCPLPYQWGALEPFISATSLKEHFTIIHKSHLTALESPLTPPQNIVESIALQLNWIHRRLLNLRTATQHSGGARMLAIRLCNIRGLVREHGGGHVNHSLFWRWMAPPRSSPVPPPGALSAAINASFGSFDRFKTLFAEAAASIAEDGWAWLVVRVDHRLHITTTNKEDNPLMRSIVADEELGIPILGIDMASHAYAHQYQNNRQAYVNAWWHVVNWNQVAADYDGFADHAALLAPPAHDVLWGGNS